MMPLRRAALLISCAMCAGIGLRAYGYHDSSINLPSSSEAVETRFDLDEDGRNDVVAIFQRRILIFFQTPQGTFPSAPDVLIGAGDPIPDTYAAVSVGKVRPEKGMQLLFIGKNGVDYLTVAQLRASASEPVEPKPLLRRNVDISTGPNLLFLDAALDLNGNGHTDIVLPNSDQLEIYEAGKDQKFAMAGKVYTPLESVQQTSLRSEPPVLGIPMLMDTQNQLVHLSPQLNRWYGIQFAVEDYTDPFLVADFNRDNRLDIITAHQVYIQDEQGRFNATPSDVYARIVQAAALHKSRLVVAPNLVDFDGDGILDTFRVETTAAKLSPRTDVSIFLGNQDRSFSEKPTFTLSTRDFAYSEVIPIGDLNRDGAQDIALLHFDFQPSSASSQLKAYMKNGLDGELRFYLWDKQRRRFNDAYSFRQRLTVNYDIYGARQVFQQQVVISEDMDGDGFPDLVMKTGRQEISVFKNRGGNKGFESRPMFTVNPPTPFSSIIVQDLNGDKRGDIIVSGYLENQDDRIYYSFFTSE